MSIQTQVFSVHLYEAVCLACGWESGDNPFTDVHSAYEAADEHECGTR